MKRSIIRPIKRVAVTALMPALLIGSLWPTSVEAETLDLQEVMKRAADRPAGAAAEARARAAAAAATVERRLALFPVVRASAGIDHRDRDLSLSTPAGAFPLGGRETWRATVAVVQPILDASRLFYSAPAARHDAQAAELIAARTREALAAEAAELFFDVQVLDARKAATQALIASLENRLSEIASLTEVGRALDRDRLRVSLALDDARHGLRTLDSRRRVVTRALGRAVGSDSPVEPRFDSRVNVPGTGTMGTGTMTAPAIGDLSRQRADLRALNAALEAADRRRAGVWSELIPRVEAQGAWIYDTGALYDDDQLIQVSVNLVWTPVLSFTRSQRADAGAAQRDAVLAELREATRGVAIEVQQALSDREVADSELAVASKSIREAEEALRVTAERYRAGRETIGDVLEAEAILRDRRARGDVARIERWRAHIRLQFANGTLASAL